MVSAVSGITPERRAPKMLCRRSPEEPSSVANQNQAAEAAAVCRSISGPELDDRVNAFVSRPARVVVFVLLCQGIQMFMSYDGGAVPASLDTLQEEKGMQWTQFEIGLLGAMDKVGMVVASLPWGYALHRCSAKFLLSCSLLVNAGCTFVFGLLDTKFLMFGAKFVMGATQALQNVWGTVWTVNMAPPDRKTMWLGLGAVSAGIGNGFGTIVAGMGTANGLPFAFAFQLAGVVLALFWIVQCCLPSTWLRTEVPAAQCDQQAQHGNAAGALVACESASTSSSMNDATFFGHLSTVVRNRVFLWTALAISLTMFQVSAIQYLWTRIFVTVWTLDKNWVTLVFLAVTGTGSGVGIGLGPWYVDRCGGFRKPLGVVHTLRTLFLFQIVASVGGTLGVGALYGKLHEVNGVGDVYGKLREATGPGSGGWGDIWLWLSWISIFLIYASQNACVAALCGINVQTVPEHLRTFASGTEITVRNVLGYIGGPLFPSIVMTLNSATGDADWELAVGLGFVYLVNFTGVFILGTARSAASTSLYKQRVAALNDLREALQVMDIGELERALVRAKTCDLHRWKNADAVTGMANEVIGRYREHGEHAIQRATRSVDDTNACQELLALERRLSEQQSEIVRLRHELLRSQAISNDHVCPRCGLSARSSEQDVDSEFIVSL